MRTRAAAGGTAVTDIARGGAVMDDGRGPMADANPFAAPLATDVAPTVARSEDDGLPLHPWRTIWTSPRRTIRRIVSRNPNLHLVPILCANGIAQSLDRASSRNAGDEVSPAALFALVLVGGALGGMFGGWLMSHALRITGRWIGGRAEAWQLLSAIAWAAVPSVVGLALWVPQLAVAGMDMFTAETPRLDASPTAAIVVLVAEIAGVVLAVWGIVLLCNTVAEVQGFRSAWAGLGNILLTILLFVAVLLAVALIPVAIVTLMRR